MNRLLVVLFAVIFAAGGLPSAARAQRIWPPFVCKTYFAATADTAPAEVVAFFHDLQAHVPPHAPDAVVDLMVRQTGLNKCANRDDARYYMLMHVAFDLGVCHYDAIDMSKLFSPQKGFAGMNSTQTEGWSHPVHYMLVSPQPCPDQSSDRYIPTGGVSPGIFRELMTVWGKISVSRPALAAIVALKPGDNDYPAGALAGFEDALFAKTPSPLKVSSVNLSQANGGPPSFELNIDHGDGGWSLDFDLSDGGWRLVGISTWVV
jgi:hypothetical protein